jgi:hypothetical protein
MTIQLVDWHTQSRPWNGVVLAPHQIILQIAGWMLNGHGKCKWMDYWRRWPFSWGASRCRNSFVSPPKPDRASVTHVIAPINSLLNGGVLAMPWLPQTRDVQHGRNLTRIRVSSILQTLLYIGPRCESEWRLLLLAWFRSHWNWTPGRFASIVHTEPQMKHYSIDL